MSNLILGAGPAGLYIADMLIKRGEKVHLVGNFIPTGEKTESATFPTYWWAAGIQQPFGGGDPNDPRLGLYQASHPFMMEHAKDSSCHAVRVCKLRTIVPTGYQIPEWSTMVEDYSVNGNIEEYLTASFDPRGLMLYYWEKLVETTNFTYEVRDFSEAEMEAVRNEVGFEDYRIFFCGGIRGSIKTFGDGKDFPILGVLLHFKGDGSTDSWMNEQKPEGTSGLIYQPECTYLIRRPRYLGGGKFDPNGHIVMGGTLKHNQWSIEEENLNLLAQNILQLCNSQFGENFRFEDILEISQCQRPGHKDGFQLISKPEKNFFRLGGQAGMGIVTAKGSAIFFEREIFE